MIRKYNETEIPRLLEIWENAALIAHPFLSDEFHQMVKKAMKEMYLPNSNTWVYEESGNILGFIAMLNNEIGGLFVDPNQQSKGIGTALVNHMNQFHDTLEVEVFEENKIGKPFYEKHGFKVIKEYVMKETNQNVLRMRK
ncbi:putative N-acetyltransferase YjaB [Polaribacter huanghezhanensis]|uniref:N-acetyltransferase n=1 Tax=Polaribacter huanghezhanensis TaxID=1354726 RepID=UPI002647B777|nr:N-acetyltransferase [Polaribacter huanghezhanensis]WKD85795.1 putative N-acetyltransferase YjaB [Polaribacter huanghezhanensis]